MKLLIKITSVIALSSALSSCSDQYRNVAADDDQYMSQSFALVTEGKSADSSVKAFTDLMETPGASLYFADAPGGAYGPVVSVSSISSYAFFGRPDLWYGMIEDIKIYFADVMYEDGGRSSGLLMAIKESGKTSYEVKVFMSTQDSFIDGGEFTAVLGEGTEEKLVLRTPYVDENDELKGVIRLDVSEFDSKGEEVDIGQFSTLVGRSVF